MKRGALNVRHVDTPSVKIAKNSNAKAQNPMVRLRSPSTLSAVGVPNNKTSVLVLVIDILDLFCAFPVFAGEFCHLSLENEKDTLYCP